VSVTPQPGEIPKTVLYTENRTDIGRHTFLKSDESTKWRQNILPPAGFPTRNHFKIGRHILLLPHFLNPGKEDKMVLIRHRLSLILDEVDQMD
jgi:hypothetical protein